MDDIKNVLCHWLSAVGGNKEIILNPAEFLTSKAILAILEVEKLTCDDFLQFVFKSYQVNETTSPEHLTCLFLIYVVFSSKPDYYKMRDVMCLLESNVQLALKRFLENFSGIDMCEITESDLKRGIQSLSSVLKSTPVASPCPGTPVRLSLASDNESPLQQFFQTPQRKSCNRRKQLKCRICSGGQRVKQMQQQMEEDEGEKLALVKELKQSKSLICELEKKLQKEILRNSNLVSDSSGLEIDVAEKIKEIESYKRKLAESARQVSIFQEDLQYTQASLSETSQQLQKLENSHTQYLIQVDDYKTKSNELESRVQWLQEQNGTLEKLLGEKDDTLNNIKESYSALLKQNVDYQAESAIFNNSPKETLADQLLVDARQTIDRLMDDNHQLSTLQQQLKDKNNSKEMELQSLQNQIDSMSCIKENLDARVNNLEKEIQDKNSNIDGLGKEISQLNMQTDEMNLNLEQLQNEIIRFKNDNSEMVNNNTCLAETIKQLENDLNTNMNIIDSLNKENCQVKAEKETLTKQCLSFKTQIAILDNKLIEFEAENKALTEHNKIQKCEMNIFEKEALEMKAENEELSLKIGSNRSTFEKKLTKVTAIKKKLTEENNSQKCDINTLKIRISELSSENEYLNKTKIDIERDISRLEQIISDSHATRDVLESQNEELRKSIESLKEEAAKKINEIQSLNELIAELKCEKHDLKMKVDELLEEISNLNQANYRFSHDVDALTELSKILKSKVLQAGGENFELSMKNDAQLNEISRLESNILDLNDENKNLLEQLNILVLETATKTDKIKMMSVENECLSKISNEVRNEMISQTNELKEITEINKNLMESIDCKTCEISNFQIEISDLLGANKALKSEHMKSQMDVSKTINDLTNKITLNNTEMANYKNEVSKLTARNQNLIEAVESKTSQLTESLNKTAKLISTNEILTMKIESVESQVVSKINDIKLVDTENQSLSKTIRDLQYEITSKTSVITNYERELLHLNEALTEAIDSKLIEMKSCQEKITELNLTTDVLTENIGNLQSEVNLKSGVIHKLEKEIKENASVNESLISNLQNVIASKSNETACCQKELAEVVANYNNLTETIASKALEINNCQKELIKTNALNETLAQKIINLQSEVDSKTTQIYNFDKDLTEMKTKNEGLIKAIDSKTFEINNYQREFTEKNSNIAQLVEKVQNLDIELSEKNVKIIESEAYNSEIKQKNDILSNEIINIQEQMLSKNIQMDSLIIEVNDVTSKKNELEVNLDKVKKELTDEQRVVEQLSVQFNREKMELNGKLEEHQRDSASSLRQLEAKNLALDEMKKTAMKNVNELLASHGQLRQELSDLVASKSAENAAMDHELKKIIETKDKLYSKLEEDYKSLEERTLSLAQINSRLSTEILKSKNLASIELSMRDDELKSLKATVSGLNNKIEQLTNLNNNLGLKNGEISTQIKELEVIKNEASQFYAKKYEMDTFLYEVLIAKQEIDNSFSNIKLQVPEMLTVINALHQKRDAVLADIIANVSENLKSAMSVDGQLIYYDVKSNIVKKGLDSLKSIIENISLIKTKRESLQELSDSLEEISIKDKTFPIINLHDDTFSIPPRVEKHASVQSTSNCDNRSWIVSPPKKAKVKEEQVKEKSISGECWVIPAGPAPVKPARKTEGRSRSDSTSSTHSLPATITTRSAARANEKAHNHTYIAEDNLINRDALVNQLKGKVAEIQKKCLHEREQYETAKASTRQKYEKQLENMKAEMKHLYSQEITKHKQEQNRLVEDLRRKNEELKKENTAYKDHVDDLRSQLWSLGDKLLQEQNTCRTVRDKDDLSQQLEKITLQPADSWSQLSNVAGSSGGVASASQPSSHFAQMPVEDEEEVFDNRCLDELLSGRVNTQSRQSRLTELQVRNSRCLPHLKSSYPAETQFDSPRLFREADLRTSTLPFGSESQSLTDSSDPSMTKSLLPSEKGKKKDQTSYKRPGPPTPSKNGRLSFQGEVRVTPKRALREQNAQEKRGTPSRLKSLFTRSSARSSFGGAVHDENAAPTTPRVKGLRIFQRKPFGGRDF